ncbi:hypothetical protein FOL47_005253 [Perkinsus chesapeaki]|uniref:Peptidase S54 rhomboid domain-containing protein n=1 Tax=Perkinsus chesapeaki TaxID=330153 RepID=A0A7J6LY98_PERCH|nr:hypothetical protein FOL47_005253 [Perkinsus chesapeaki]
METPPSRGVISKVDRLEQQRLTALQRLQPVFRSPVGVGASEWKYKYKRWINDKTAYPVTWTMLVLAGMTYLLWGFLPPRFMNRNFTVSRENLMHGRFHTLLTASLSHTSFTHLLVNSFVVFIYGTQLEKLLGGAALIRIAMISAIAGSLGHVLTASDRRDAAVGGSGIAFGLLTASCLLEPNLTVYIWGMWPITQKKLLAGAVSRISDSSELGSNPTHHPQVLALEAIWAFASLGESQAGGRGGLMSHSPGVSHSAHLLGAASAPLALYWLRWFAKIR